jgi:Uma2 family endonuclease
MLTLNLSSVGTLTSEAFYQLCRQHPDLKLERSALGELVIMAPTGGETGQRNSTLAIRLGIWAEGDGTGLTFDSSTAFHLPNGADRSPDAAWIRLDRWNALSPEDRQKFPPLAPDFVVEIRSASDSLAPLQTKLQEYIDNGVRLAWLLDPKHKFVEIYRPNQSVERLIAPSQLTGEDVLPGFVLNLDRLLT